MRKLAYCLLSGAAALVLTYGASGSGEVLGAVLQSGKAPAATFARVLKGDRVAAQTTNKAETKVATVEIVGIDSAAVVFRDHSGRVLYQTDPVANTTVLARGVTVPTVTIRSSLEASRTPAPAAAPAASENPAPAKNEKPTKSAKPVPEGCELAVSPLSESASAGAPFRCFAQMHRSETKLAALR
jgi:hypothetical protein